nr:L-threonylcarbamoyladenylate synthase [bacterium]
MTTRVLSSQEQDAILEAAQLLRQGEVVVFPTETVYGLGANALREDAVKKIFAAKGRPADNPLIAHIAAPEQAHLLVADWPPVAQALSDAFWPGPLTLILPKKDCVPSMTTGGMDTVAVRCPAHPVARALIQAAGFPIAAPSANLSGRPSPTTADDCLADLDGRVPLILDGGPSIIGLESTVVDLTGEAPTVLRPGGISPEDIARVAGDARLDAAVLSPLGKNQPVRSPGMKYRHYAPRAHVTLLDGPGAAHALARRVSQARTEGETAFVLYSGQAPQDVPHTLCMDGEAPYSALYTALRRADRLGADHIFALLPGQEGVALAARNRLLRAAAFEVIWEAMP